MSPPYLTTARMTLHHPRPTDLDSFDTLNRDPGVMQFLDWQPPTRQEVAAELAQTIRGQADQPDFGRFVARDRETGQFLGWFGLELDGGGTAAPELGYRLRAATWGRGLATEGGRALVDHAFGALGCAQVNAQTMYVNARSRRVMEKCGLRYLHTFHEHFDNPLPGTEHGEVRYRITREEWRQPEDAASAT